MLLFSLKEMCRWQLCTKHTDARPHTESGMSLNEHSFFALSVYGTTRVSVRFGNIIHYIRAADRDRLQKNETNHVVRPRLLLSESIVRPSCIGWGSCVERSAVSPTARRRWMPVCLSSGGRAARQNMALSAVLKRGFSPPPPLLSLFCSLRRLEECGDDYSLGLSISQPCGWTGKSCWDVIIDFKDRDSKTFRNVGHC